jgi:T5orf172 domain
MINAGYIYILINPSLSGLLKIGKTTRLPEERAKGLSDATGVPTPFIVAFDEYFEDCDYAEQYFYSLLQQRGLRIAENREFFSIPLKDAIRTLLDVKATLSTLGSHRNEQVQANTIIEENTRQEPWHEKYKTPAEIHGKGKSDES